MKKYLMTGIAALAMGAGFMSCSHDDDVYDPNAAENAKAAQYQQLFETQFGKISSEQNWGFTDQSQYTLTRDHDVNRDQWGSNKESDGLHGKLAIPANVSPDEREWVYNYFNSQRVGATNQNNIIWTDFVVTQVWKGEDKYYDDNQYNWTETPGQTPVKGSLKADAQYMDQPASDKMNQICVKFNDNNVPVGDNRSWEHVNDFNTGNHNSEWGDIKGHTYMLNSGTYDFCYHNVVDSKYHNEYIIIPGSEIHPSLAGYYYIGFDFLADGGYVDDNGIMQQKNMRCDRDWVFTDWIIRVSPAEFLGQQRVFVEDLIATDLKDVKSSDWDFNDAVFDAFMYDGKAVITLRAAGGTLPLTVGGVEVHQAFGVNTNQMVNTGKGPEKAPVQFRISVNSTNANDIPVVVTKDDKQTTLLAERGMATQKLAAPIEEHVKWMLETHLITGGYPSFVDYVSNPSVKWWNPAIQSELFQKWY